MPRQRLGRIGTKREKQKCEGERKKSETILIHETEIRVYTRVTGMTSGVRVALPSVRRRRQRDSHRFPAKVRKVRPVAGRSIAPAEYENGHGRSKTSRLPAPVTDGRGFRGLLTKSIAYVIYTHIYRTRVVVVVVSSSCGVPPNQR